MIKFNVVSRKNPITKEVKYYAAIAPVTPVTLDDITRRIVANCTVTEHDVKAVLSALQEQLVEVMLEGNSVRLGDLGSFRPTIGSAGKATREEVSSADVRRLTVRFRAGSRLHSELALTSTRVRFTQAAGPSGGGTGDNIGE